jgi:CheY-like chemotaxis protein
MSHRFAVLLVEDDPAQASEYARRLEEKGCRVQAVSSAEEAVLLARTTHFDMILSDNILPGMTGLRALPELARWSCAPVLIMTSHPCAEGEKDALLLGAAAYLKKPLDVADAFSRAWGSCTAFQAVNETLREFYVGLAARPLAPGDIASRHRKNPPAAIVHWKEDHQVRYSCADGGLSGPDCEAFVREYAGMVARPGWRALAG